MYYYLFFENILRIFHQFIHSLISLFKTKTAFLQLCQDAIVNVKSYHAINIFYVNKMNVGLYFFKLLHQKKLSTAINNRLP